MAVGCRSKNRGKQSFERHAQGDRKFSSIVNEIFRSWDYFASQEGGFPTSPPWIFGSSFIPPCLTCTARFPALFFYPGPSPVQGPFSRRFRGLSDPARLGRLMTIK